VRLERDVAVPMRDGTTLYADVYLPDGTGPFPALLERTPYNKQSSSEITLESPRVYTEHGYAVVIQDVRGRFRSGGDFYPFRDDGWGPNRDGYDTVEWIAAQSWSDGKVGTIGGSYSGVTQYRLTPTRPPHLAAQFVRESSSDYHREWTYRGGALELGFAFHWALRVALSNLDHAELAARAERFGGVEALRARLAGADREIHSWMRQRPQHPRSILTGIYDWWDDWLAHPSEDAYWWDTTIALHHHEFDTPIWHLGGWFDSFLRGTLVNYEGVVARGRANARPNQKLIVAPWIHGPANINVSKVGEIDYGPAAAVDLHSLRLPWFDHWLKGAENGIMDEPPVRIFTMGSNEWQSLPAWPPPDVRHEEWYLHGGSSGSARSLNDGSLATDLPPVADGPDSYLYDPDDPVLARGGGWLTYAGDPTGGYDQRPVEGRVLTYTSAPLSHDLEVTGWITARLFAMSSAPDTDFVVRLSDVDPDGLSRIVADGVLRARYRSSLERPEPLTPNKVEAMEVDLWASSNLFRAGHRIRVAVTSSCWPRWDANPNTGGPVHQEARAQAALNTVFHDAFRPSSIRLPVRRR
jgi:putative CocE/NonD family hydrolase